MSKAKKKPAKKLKTGEAQMDYADPNFLGLEQIFVEGVLDQDKDANELYFLGKDYCKEKSLKGFTRAEAHRIYDRYRKASDESAKQGPFFTAAFRLELTERAIRHELLQLMGQFTSDNPQDIRDHASDISAVQSGTGAPWRTACVGALRKLQDVGVPCDGLEEKMQGVFSQELAAEEGATEDE